MNALLICALSLFAEPFPLPEAEAEIAFHSCKVERGMCENPDPIYGLEAEVELLGAFIGIEALYDLSDRNGRLGRYNEITPCAGYGYAFADWLKANMEYRFKQEVGDHTHELAWDVEMPLPWLTPFFHCELDVGDCAGAFYGVVGAERGFQVLSWMELVGDCGIGFGNATRNEADFGRDNIGFRDIHIGCTCRCRICEHLHLCPYCRLHQQLTEAAREEYNNGFVVDAGVSLAANF